MERGCRRQRVVQHFFSAASCTTYAIEEDDHGSPQNPPTLPKISAISHGLISVMISRESTDWANSIDKYAKGAETFCQVCRRSTRHTTGTRKGRQKSVESSRPIGLLTSAKSAGSLHPSSSPSRLLTTHAHCFMRWIVAATEQLEDGTFASSTGKQQAVWYELFLELLSGTF